MATWPKLLQNLRATRETELKKEYPDHVVHAWIGNSKEVAEDHYLMVTDADYERATTGSSGSPIYPAQNPAQCDTVSGLAEPCDEKEKVVIPARNEDHDFLTTPTGSRMHEESTGETAVEENAGPQSGPLWVAPDLGDLIRLLSELPEDQRQALVSLMRHAADG